MALLHRMALALLLPLQAKGGRGLRIAAKGVKRNVDSSWAIRMPALVGGGGGGLR